MKKTERFINIGSEIAVDVAMTATRLYGAKVVRIENGMAIVIEHQEETIKDLTDFFMNHDFV